MTAADQIFALVSARQRAGEVRKAYEMLRAMLDRRKRQLEAGTLDHVWSLEEITGLAE